MGRCCEVCGKGTSVGYNVPRKGLCKKKGGTGSKIGVRTKRTFKANLVDKSLNVDGEMRKVKICMRCLRTLNKVEKYFLIHMIKKRQYLFGTVFFLCLDLLKIFSWEIVIYFSSVMTSFRI